MNSVLSKSRLWFACRIAAGCVVSRTWNEPASNVFARTCGARLEPPMPSRTNVSITPGAVTSSTKRRRSSIRPRIRIGSSSQPSHFASSPPVQSVASRAQIRSTSSAGAIVLIRPPRQSRARAPRTRADAPCSERAQRPQWSRGARPGSLGRAGRRSHGCRERPPHRRARAPAP